MKRAKEIEGKLRKLIETSLGSLFPWTKKMGYYLVHYIILVLKKKLNVETCSSADFFLRHSPALWEICKLFVFLIIYAKGKANLSKHPLPPLLGSK